MTLGSGRKEGVGEETRSNGSKKERRCTEADVSGTKEVYVVGGQGMQEDGRRKGRVFDVKSSKLSRQADPSIPRR